MSRSYKKNPYYCKKDKFFKNYFNRKVRRSTSILHNGCSYKKICYSWKIFIHEYYYRETFKERLIKQKIDNLQYYRGYLSENFYENTNSNDFYMNWYRCFKEK